MWNDGSVHSVEQPQIRTRGFRYGDQGSAAVRRGPEKELPGGQVEGAEIFGAALVLEIVEHGHAGARRQQGAGESRVQQHVAAGALYSEGQAELFIEDALRAILGAHLLRRSPKICRAWDERRVRFAIGENEVFVHRVDFGERVQEAAQIDLRAANSAGNEIESVNADAQSRSPLWHGCLQTRERFANDVICGVEPETELVLRDGLGVLSLSGVHAASIVIDHVVGGPSLLSGIKGEERLIVVAMLPIDHRELRVAVRGGFHCERLLNLLDRSVGFAGAVISEPPVEE